MLRPPYPIAWLPHSKLIFRLTGPHAQARFNLANSQAGYLIAPGSQQSGALFLRSRYPIARSWHGKRIFVPTGPQHEGPLQLQELSGGTLTSCGPSGRGREDWTGPARNLSRGADLRAAAPRRRPPRKDKGPAERNI